MFITHRGPTTCSRHTVSLQHSPSTCSPHTVGIQHSPSTCSSHTVGQRGSFDKKQQQSDTNSTKLIFRILKNMSTI